METIVTEPGRIQSVEMMLPSLAIGGMERMVVQLALRLLARDWVVGVTCISAEGELFASLRDQGVAVRLEPVGRGEWLGPKSLIRLLQRSRPTVLHTHSGFWLRGVMAGARAGVARRVHTVHGLYVPEPWTFPLEIGLAGRLSTKTVAVSHEIRQHLLRRGAIPPNRVVTVTNGVDVDEFRPGERSGVRKKLGIADQAIVVGTVARLNEIKNLSMAIDAVATCVRHGIDMHFVVIGDGPDRLRLEARAAGLGIESRFHLTGMSSETSDWYREFDFFVNTSFKEGTSLSLLEAMASGLPCVATDVGGNSDVLEAGMAGELVPSADAESLAARLHSLLREPGRRKALGRTARERAVRCYSLDAMVASYERLYTDPQANL